MALRDFIDAEGRSWTVWEVRPTSDVRLRSTRGQREDEDKHRLLRDGWLVFETSGERRRLVPIPDTWESAAVEELARLCSRAEQVPTRRRLIE